MTSVPVRELPALKAELARRLLPQAAPWFATGMPVDDVLALYPLNVLAWQAKFVALLRDDTREVAAAKLLLERVWDSWHTIKLPKLRHTFLQVEFNLRPVRLEVIETAVRIPGLDDTRAGTFRPFMVSIDMLALWLAGESITASTSGADLVKQMVVLWLDVVDVYR